MKFGEARADAFEHYIARRSEEGLGEEGEPERRGWREFHIRQSAGDIIAGAAEQLAGDWRKPGYSKALRKELANRGFYSLKMKSGIVDKLRLSMAEYPEEEASRGVEDGGGGGSHEHRAERLAAEYVPFSDFSLLLRADVQFEDVSFLKKMGVNGGTFYSSREINQTWGIFIDVETLHEQLEEMKRQDKHIGIEECRLFLLWNLYHEYFHYKTEMACAKINPPEEGQERKSFGKYEEYIDKTQWGHWECALNNCSKLPICSCRRGPAGGGVVDVYHFSGVGGDCACMKKFERALPHADEGYQYPLEEGMANAYAIRKLRKTHALDPILVKDYIDTNQPLGYSDYAHFNPEARSPKAFKLGERILTRMLQGMKAPKVNVLQHKLLDVGPDGLDFVLTEERSLFRTNRMKGHNGYDAFGKIDEIPVHIIERRNRGDLSRMVKKLLKEADLV